MNQECSKFEDRTRGIWSAIFEILLKKIFKVLVCKSPNLYVSATDLMAVNVMVTGIHDACLSYFIKKFSDHGYHNFFVDIGANIGLVSCEIGNHFDKVVMYEPNLDCFPVLELNAKRSIKVPYEAIPAALSSRSGKSALNIPVHNNGGAFISDFHNSYNENELAAKDGFDKYETLNYSVSAIRTLNARAEFKRLFCDFEKSKFFRGIIKIDTEGYEQFIIENLLNQIPKNISCVIFFESWQEGLNFENTFEHSGRILEFYKVSSYPNFNPKDSIINKFKKLIFSKRSYTFDSFSCGDSVGNFAIIVK